MKAKSFVCLCFCALTLAVWPSFVQSEEHNITNVSPQRETEAGAKPSIVENGDNSTPDEVILWRSPLVIIECLWLALIGIGAPMYSWLVSRGCTDKSNLRGFNMPRGSIRGILALLIVGSFVNVLVFGGPVLGDSLHVVVSAFGTLAGSVTGFYFGSRTATPST